MTGSDCRLRSDTVLAWLFHPKSRRRCPSFSTRSFTKSGGQRVILDADLARLYEVETRILTRAVTRHHERFPADFMFQLTSDEAADLRSQIGISSGTHGGRRFLPYAFTEQGVAMLSSVLGSPRAVAVNIEIVRAFVRMRRVGTEHADLSARIDDLESRYDESFATVFTAIRDLMAPRGVPSRKLGFPAP